MGIRDWQVWKVMVRPNKDNKVWWIDLGENETFSWAHSKAQQMTQA